MAVKVRERNGAWWVFVDWRGRRKARRVGPGPGGKRAAQVAAEQIQARLVLGDLSILDPPTPAPTAHTLRTYATVWLDTTARLRCKPSTLEHYAALFRRHWLPALGDRSLAAISREDIKGELARLAGRMRATSIRGNLLVALQACLSAAVDDGLLAANPAARLGRYVRSDVLPQARVDPFTREELAHLLATIQRERPEWYPWALTLARTGLRIGEVIALRPEDVDFRAGCVWVRQAAYLGRISTPKNGRGRRVDMSRQLADVLRDWLTTREAEAVVAGRLPGPWLFPAPRGGLLQPREVTRTVWGPLLARAGLRYRNLHQTRHTFASLLIQQGESLAYVRDQLGHHSISLTVDVYGHLIPGANRQAVDRLDDATVRNLPATASAMAGSNVQ